MKNVKVKNFLEMVVYGVLIFNPVVFGVLSFVISPWLSWGSLIVLLIVITTPISNFKNWRKTERRIRFLGKLPLVLHILIILFAIGFTLHAIWPNLYASIGQGISWFVATLWQLIVHNPWIFIIAIAIVVLFQLFKKEIFILLDPNFNLQAVQGISKDVQPWAVYLKVRLSSNQVQKLETLLNAKFYSYKIFKRYFELVINERHLINRERQEFKLSTCTNRLKIHLVFSFLELFAYKYQDEKSTKFVKEEVYKLAQIMNSRVDEIINNAELATEARKDQMRREQASFAIQLFRSPLRQFSNWSEVAELVLKAKNKIAKEQSKENKKKAERDWNNKLKKIVSGNVLLFISNFDDLNNEEEVLQSFFNNLSLRKFEEYEIITGSRLKGKANWTNDLDLFFDNVSTIMGKTMNDELIAEIVKAIKRLRNEIEELEDDNLNRIIKRKEFDIPNYILLKTKVTN